MNRPLPFVSIGIICFTCLLFACNSQVAKSPSPGSLVIFPPPPDTTRIQFLTYFSSSDDLEGDQGAFQRFLFGEEPPLNMIKPYGITVH
ncbi:MAG: hypothetical protein P1P86_08365 [Bacteroidales bacterium]|nr:hypothetical protein [Bacteroidales bacterium]